MEVEVPCRSRSELPAGKSRAHGSDGREAVPAGASPGLAKDLPGVAHRWHGAEGGITRRVPLKAPSGSSPLLLGRVGGSLGGGQGRACVSGTFGAVPSKVQCAGPGATPAAPTPGRLFPGSPEGPGRAAGRVRVARGQARPPPTRPSPAAVHEQAGRDPALQHAQEAGQLTAARLHALQPAGRLQRLLPRLPPQREEHPLPLHAGARRPCPGWWGGPSSQPRTGGGGGTAGRTAEPRGLGRGLPHGHTWCGRSSAGCLHRPTFFRLYHQEQHRKRFLRRFLFNSLF